MIIHDHHSAVRKRWLRQQQQSPIDQQPAQSDFENSFALRLTFLVAAFVIGLNLLSPDPTPKPTHAVVHPTV